MVNVSGTLPYFSLSGIMKKEHLTSIGKFAKVWERANYVILGKILFFNTSYNFTFIRLTDD